MFVQNSKRNTILVLSCLFVTCFIILVSILSLVSNSKEEVNLSKLATNSLQKVDIGVPHPATSYVPSKDYFKKHEFATVPKNYETFTVFSTEDIIEESPASFIVEQETTPITLKEAPSDANKALYNLADKYFICYYGSDRVSPILPLALANVETGGRADYSKTWSALFPSRIVPLDYLYTMDVTTVISDASYYNSLSKEYSTRDRGALQMSPTYGTGDSYFNGLMSGTEVSKLKNVDTSNYTTWCQGASSNSGDRFYIPDVCLRLSAAYTQAVSYIVNNGYQPKSDLQLIAQLAMHHQQSAVWCKSNHELSVGKWRSGKLAYEYSQLITSQDFVNVVSNYVKSNPNKFFIDADEANALFKSTGKDMDTYATSSMVCTYPIKVIYAYIKLCTMYST